MANFALFGSVVIPAKTVVAKTSNGIKETPFVNEIVSYTTVKGATKKHYAVSVDVKNMAVWENGVATDKTQPVIDFYVYPRFSNKAILDDGQVLEFDISDDNGNTVEEYCVYQLAVLQVMKFKLAKYDLASIKAVKKVTLPTQNGDTEVAVTLVEVLDRMSKLGAKVSKSKGGFLKLRIVKNEDGTYSFKAMKFVPNKK